MVIQPEIDDLLARIGNDSKYTLCIVAAKRARQINDMLHGVRDQALLTMSAPQIAQFASTKPLSLALEEIAAGDVNFRRDKDGTK